MGKEKNTLHLTDLIDIEFLQEFQDIFAEIMNIASQTFDVTTEITKPSNFSDFCLKYTKGSKIGRERCKECDLKWGKIAAETNRPVIYICHAGLTDFAIPIKVGNQHFGTIFGGQVLTKEPDFEEFKQAARELKINENEYINELKKIKIISEEQLKIYVKFLSKIANTISKLGHKNYELIKLNARGKTLRSIHESIRSSLDINETKKSIVNIIGKTLNPDVCFIAEYNKNDEIPFQVSEMYMASKEFCAFKAFDTSKLVPNFAKAVQEGKTIIINDKKINLEPEDEIWEPERQAIDATNVTASIVLPLFYQKELLGAVALHYINSDHKINGDEIELMTIISYQISTALHHAKTYKMAKVLAQEEKINRNISEILRSSLDKNTIKKLFVKNIGEHFKADRVIFCEYDRKNKIFLPADEHSEYLPNPNDKSFVNYAWTDSSISEFVKPLIEKKELNIFCWTEFIKQKKFSRGFISLFEDALVKSSYNLPVIYQDKLMGFFCIEYIKKERRLNERELELIRNITSQAGIGLYHSELYIKAQESSKAKSEFIANMSHELKTPLNIIIGFSDIMANKELSREKEIDYLNNINKSGKHLLSLTNDIINISKIESGNFKLNFENLNSEEIIKQSVNAIELLAKEKNIKIKLKTEKIDIKADEKMLTQVLYNLLSNAIKFTPEGGIVEIFSKYSDGELIVSIEDNGIGIDKNHHEVIFEKFRQIDSSYSRKQQGAGLGLAIIKKIIEMHNGRIHVESQKNQGSRFWFILPNASKKLQMVEIN